MSHTGNIHRHVCSSCDRVWKCSKYDCDEGHDISFLTCGPCTQAAPLAQPQNPVDTEKDKGIHLHVCPACNRGWDCSNECGEESARGMIMTVECDYCRTNVHAEKSPMHTDLIAGSNLIAQRDENRDRDRMVHSHICVVSNRTWSHDDIECAFETMMDPQGMKYLESPESFIFTAPCPQCNESVVEEEMLAHSNKERAYWCKTCNFIFRITDVS